MVPKAVKPLHDQVLLLGVRIEGIKTKGGIDLEIDKMFCNLSYGRVLAKGPEKTDCVEVGDLVMFSPHEGTAFPMYTQEDQERPSPCFLSSVNFIKAVVEDHHGKADEDKDSAE